MLEIFKAVVEVTGDRGRHNQFRAGENSKRPLKLLRALRRRATRQGTQPHPKSARPLPTHLFTSRHTQRLVKYTGAHYTQASLAHHR
jgi:hypothetical protein